jgi:predicted nuclease with TOPRIM domain
MQEQLTNRLKELKAEFEAGQKKLAEIEGQANDLRTTMLRISGAIQVLEEELAKAGGPRPTLIHFVRMLTLYSIVLPWIS